MLLLARAGTLAQVGDWTRNLMQWFPDLPDAAVLWAELRSALAGGDEHPFGGTRHCRRWPPCSPACSSAACRGLRTRLELADSQVRFLRRALLPEALAARVARLGAMDRAHFSAVTLPGGHFLVVPGLPRPEWLGGGGEALSVEEILALLRRLPES